MIFNLGTFGVFLYTSLYFQHVLGYSPVKAGAALLPWILMLIVVGPFTGKLADRLDAAASHRRRARRHGGRPAPAHRHRRAQPLGDLLPGLIIGGLGGALTIPLNGVAVGAAPVEKSGVASGIFNTARETGGSLGIAVIGAVLATGSTAAAAARARVRGRLRRGLAVAAGLALLAAIVALLTIREPRPAPTAVAQTQTAVPGAQAA